MESYEYLLYVAIILLSTKILGLFSRRLHMPQVVGALLAGIVLGPSCLHLVSFDGSGGEFLSGMAEIGVLMLMFSAGLETDIKELKKNSLPAALIAGIGVLVPVLGGFASYMMIFPASGYLDILKAVFIGVVLSATSVSITVETLKELGKMNGRVGSTILGAAIIDDILGIIVLTIVSSLQDASINIGMICLKIALYFVFVGAVFFIVHKGKRLLERYDGMRRISIVAISFCLIMAFVSEEVFGIADITGAYFAGLILCNLQMNEYINNRIGIASYLFFSPIFFASIGLKTTLSGMESNLLVFTVVLLVVAILSKVVGCGIGAKLCHFSNKDSLQIGVGMISRGEVALIVAQKGFQYGMLDTALFAPIVLVVIITTLITPVLLKLVMKDKVPNFSFEDSKVFVKA